MQNETLDQYESVVLSRVGDAGRRDAMRENAVQASAEGSLYGPFEGSEGVAQMYLRNAAATCEDGEFPPALVDLSAEQVAEAIDVVTGNMVRTDVQYKEARPGVDIDALNGTRADIMKGLIRSNGESFLPQELAMTEAEGVAQVEHANRGFESRPSREQLLIADVNYRSWTSDIMSTGDDMLQGASSLRELIDQDADAGMAHLRASNMMMGEHVAALAEGAGKMPVTVVDLGAGSGATTAMNTIGLASSSHEGNLRMVGIEGTHSFYKAISEGQLPKDVLNRLKRGGYEVGDTLVENPLDAASAGNESSYGVAYGDMLDCVNRLTLTPEQAEGLVVVTANYCLHRLPLTVKRAMFKKLGELARNVVVVMGDLWENASFINRHYFNFGANGPANCGNRGFESMLADAGYKVGQLTEENAPRGVNQELLTSITAGVSNDARFLVGARGEDAQGIVSGWKA